MFDAERSYLESLKTPNPSSDFAVQYVRKLRLLAEKQAAHNKVFGATIVYSQSDIDNYRNQPGVKDTNKEHQYQHKIASDTRKREAQRRAASEQLMVVLEEVAKMEEEGVVDKRWEPGCPEWEAAVQREELDEYYKTLRDVELLMVQRITELDKAHSAGIAYRIRTRMAKEINQREKAVRNALDRYNAVASRLNPPRPVLEFSDLTEHAYLANFDFLRYSEHGANEAEWSRPIHRRCTDSWQKVQRAKEEIDRLNVEIRRVWTHIRDEEAFLTQRYSAMKDSDPDLAFALHARMELAVRANQRVRRDLEAIAKLPGFTGKLEFGTAVRPAGVDSCVLRMGREDAGELGQLETLGDLGDMQHEILVAPVEVVEAEPSDQMQQTMTVMEETCATM
ncbi:hypothetical protein FRC08_001757 [Ceratobasidium sp. 394]|nr:hypothetical protein FRC08_001757 [Ceratobasidium sp. 394]